jgi:flagellar biosynthesis protein FlhF
MKVHRFIGQTARESLARVREGLGPDAMILSNRSVSDGIEIMACSEEDYIAVISTHAPNPLASSNHSKAAQPASEGQDNMLELMTEIRTMRDSLETQLSEMDWIGQQQRHPTKSGILKVLLAAGLSPSLARYLTEKNTQHDGTVEAGITWAKNMLTRNLAVLPSDDDVLDEGGVYALVGPTGVGKTTTIAKLAARCVMRNGPGKLALITTDSYRIGAHEQLHIYGKLLGVMVHFVKDDVDLRIALDELKNKHTILIDTVGMSQRDQMVAAQIAMFSGTQVPIKRLICLNTSSTIDTLNEVVNAYRGSGLAGCILTKLDEAASISGALDVVLRQKLKIFYIASGQRVPEDLQVPDARELVEQAFKPQAWLQSATFLDSELPMVMSSASIRRDSSVKGLHVD